MALSVKEKSTRSLSMTVNVEKYNLWEIICTLYAYRGGLFISDSEFCALGEWSLSAVNVTVGRRSLYFLIRWSCVDATADAVKESVAREALENSHYVDYVSLGDVDVPRPRVSRGGRFY